MKGVGNKLGFQEGGKVKEKAGRRESTMRNLLLHCVELFKKTKKTVNPNITDGTRR